MMVLKFPLRYMCFSIIRIYVDNIDMLIKQDNVMVEGTLQGFLTGQCPPKENLYPWYFIHDIIIYLWDGF